MVRSKGKFVYKCPTCGGRNLRTFEYVCLKCKEEFFKPTRQVFRTRTDALRAHGMYTIDKQQKAHEIYVDVCPACGSNLLVDGTFKCVCGATFSRWDAVLIWEVETNGQRV